MDRKLKFTVEKTELIETSNAQLTKLRLWIVREGNNRHNLPLSWASIQSAKPTLVGKPVLCAYDQYRDRFQGHEDSEIPVGVLLREDEIYEDEISGQKWLVADAYIWKVYFPQIVDVFRRNDGESSISMEIEVFETHDEDGIEWIDSFAFLGVTLIGVSPAIPDAKAVVLQFSEFVKETEELLELDFVSKYEGLDFSIPDDVKTSAQKGLDLYKQYGVGGNSVSLSNARHLIKNSSVSFEKARQIHRFLNNHSADDLQETTPPKKEFVAWCLHGGNYGLDWSKKLVESMDEIDRGRSSYFREITTFPYKSREDMNPALKGIDPPVSVSQANEIARQADAIGQDDEKNGWAIAISNFKKTHHVQDGKWVKNKSDKEDSKKDMAVDDEKEKKEKEESPEEEKQETPEEEKKEDSQNQDEKKPDDDKKEKMAEEDKKDEGEEKPADGDEKEEYSLDANLDVSAMLAMLEKETDSYREIAGEFAKPENERNYAKVVGAFCKQMEGMCNKMSALEEQNKSYMGANAELSKFKADVEGEKFSFEVEATINDVKAYVPQTEIDNFREKAKEFSLATIDGWKNLVRAKAFEFSKGKQEKTDYTPIGLPWGNAKNKDSKSLWK